MKDFNISLLLDFYGNLLSEKQLLIMENYYQEDLSLSEIGEISGMTRQGVYDNIRRAGNELKQYEEKLGLLAKFTDITESADEIAGLIEPGMIIDEVKYQKISKLLDIIRNKA